ncbi:MAG: transcriptional repressor LexA [Candidatus Omnitrophica bacterium]|nr:transcriptional repressor LexA [Candidatus Omnitrophota bacterium]
MAQPLTPKQKEVLRFIACSVSVQKMSPTIREIGRHFGFSSTGTVRDHLRALAAKGYLARARKKARAIELADAACGIPIIGRIAAGSPLEANENIEGFLRPEEAAPLADDVFALRVQGDSMSGAGIVDGDIVIVRRQKQARQGDIVVALVGGEATVKTLRKQGSRMWLVPHNKKYRPLSCSGSTVIAGKVISVVRRYV